MFDTNNFKRSVKDWVKMNPKGTVTELTDFCEELIPPQQFQANSWLIDQTLGWYEHVLNSRKHDQQGLTDDSDDES
jgi:hypothetical protein